MSRPKPPPSVSPATPTVGHVPTASSALAPEDEVAVDVVHGRAAADPGDRAIALERDAGHPRDVGDDPAGDVAVAGERMAPAAARDGPAAGPGEAHDLRDVGAGLAEGDRARLGVQARVAQGASRRPAGITRREEGAAQAAAQLGGGGRRRRGRQQRRRARRESAAALPRRTNWRRVCRSPMVGQRRGACDVALGPYASSVAASVAGHVVVGRGFAPSARRRRRRRRRHPRRLGRQPASPESSRRSISAETSSASSPPPSPPVAAAGRSGLFGLGDLLIGQGIGADGDLALGSALDTGIRLDVTRDVLGLGAHIFLCHGSSSNGLIFRARTRSTRERTGPRRYDPLR